MTLLLLLRGALSSTTSTEPELTWPRTMPVSMPFRAVSFDVMYQQTAGTTRGGLTQVANIGVDLWRAKFDTPPLSKSEALEWKAWLHSLRGGARLFKAWDPVRRYARAYPSGYAGMIRASGAGFDGLATLSEIATTRDAITLSDLPAGFKLQSGDLLNFSMGGTLVALHEVIHSATASSFGTLTVNVEPTIPLAASAGVNVSLEKPYFVACLDAKSVSAPWQLGQRAAVSFSATQIFL